MKLRALVLILTCCVFSAWGQSLLRTDTVKVLIGASPLNNAWAGGINNAQISSFDLNNDALKDLVIFDKTGFKLSTFVNTGSAGVPSFRHAPQYEASFPLMHDWALFADFNCDGKEDIFTYNSGSVSAYLNTSSGGTVSFILYKKVLRSDYNPNDLPLYVSAVDIPSITDIDNDGDLDILSFSVFGSSVEFHKNMSKETYGHCDSLVYFLDDKCWGSFTENPSACSANLQTNCPHRDLASPGGNRDAGFALLHFDSDADGDKELLVSTINCNTFYLLTNTGTPAVADITSVEYNYPSSGPVNLTRFPAAYMADVNNDGKRDLLISPNAPNISENLKSVLLYRNTGTDNAPVWDHVQNDFLQGEMIDVGEAAAPVFFDYDKDGLTDLFVSNYGYFQNSSFKSQIAYFRNTGTSTQPQFTLITRDFESISQRGINSMAPTFGDLDNDGDADIMIGDINGMLQYMEYTGSSYTHIANYKNSSNVSIDVGNYAAPQLFDLDKDGKLDLIIGERSGNLNFFRNTGTTTAPSFTLATDSLGKINVTQKGFTQGYSKPFFLRENGETKLFVGSERGYLFAFDNIDGNLNGKFRLIDSIYQGINEGSRLAVGGADINSDGMIELALGNSRGGVALYRGIGFVSTEEYKSRTSFRMYPNPATNHLTIEGADSGDEARIFDLRGVEVLYFLIKEGSSIDLNGLPAGAYIVRLNSKGHYRSGKLIVH